MASPALLMTLPDVAGLAYFVSGATATAIVADLAACGRGGPGTVPVAPVRLLQADSPSGASHARELRAGVS